jgi:hypothetical protein
MCSCHGHLTYAYILIYYFINLLINYSYLWFRLSENPNISVLLLEAGGEGSALTEVPAAVGLGLNSPIDWNYR